IASYDRKNGKVFPRKLRWQGRDYAITKLAYYHKIRQGQALYHIFHVTDGNIDFRLKLDSFNLHWTLEEVSDGSAD
ncbi:MAG: hypothetical protein WEC80_00520, partial [Patescibacteria group bacterium]